MKKILLVALVSAISASPAFCADAAKAGKASILDSLKDPESARFRNSFVNGKNYCGEVNAKNSYGGYVGFRRFIVSDWKVTIDNSSESFDEEWREACWSNEKKKAYAKLKADQLAEVERDIERKRAAVRRAEEERDRAEKTIVAPENEDIIATAHAIAEKKIIPLLSSTPKYTVTDAFLYRGRFICGTVANGPPSTARLFATDRGDGPAFIQGQSDWSDGIWAVYCR